MSRGTQSITVFESSRIGLRWNNISQNYRGFRVNEVMLYMVIGLVVLSVLAIYLDTVSSSFGGKKSWLHPCRSSQAKKLKRKQKVDPNMELNSIADKRNYEPLDPSFHQ